MAILVGCSGWSYDDWVGAFYPVELANKKGEWFDYYSQYFSTVEINSTFYRPPGERQVKAWISKAKNKKGFEYSLKVPQLVTHKALVEGDKERAIFWATSFEKTCVRPLAEVGLLGGVLLQLSPYFKNEGFALDSLNNVLDAVSHQDFDYVVEFRHRSWLDESKKGLDSATLDALKERNVANVLIDGPGLHVGTEQTADHAPWVPQIKEAELKEAKMRIYFNNHARAKSVRNAFLLMDLLLMEHKQKEIKSQD
jgi:uncharacterized protein YecE (DUF72 family)